MNIEQFIKVRNHLADNRKCEPIKLPVHPGWSLTRIEDIPKQDPRKWYEVTELLDCIGRWFVCKP